ncbi:MAG: hypothetical protein JW969_14125 [Spirochaetales bacterium]|nr:hypothetical protein [Spirochaetales bacterium]
MVYIIIGAVVSLTPVLIFGLYLIIKPEKYRERSIHRGTSLGKNPVLLEKSPFLKTDHIRRMGVAIIIMDIVVMAAIILLPLYYEIF